NRVEGSSRYAAGTRGPQCPDGNAVGTRVRIFLHQPRRALILARASWGAPLEAAPMLAASPAVKIGLSIAVATGLYGISFGALAVASGLDVWQTVALSLLMFTGGSQFAFIGVLAGGGSGSAACGAATLLGIRNAVYGMQMN